MAPLDGRHSEVRVRDGETLIIGGLNQERTTEQLDKMPILGDIPFLGALFRRTDKTPQGLVQCLLANLAQIREHLEQGSVVVIEDTRVRVRRLPFVALP